MCKALCLILGIWWKHETVPPFKKLMVVRNKSKQKRQANMRYQKYIVVY